MQVGVYIDGFNLYYGGIGLVGGHGVAGWRWIDLRLLSSAVVAAQSGWGLSAAVSRVVYCTARISGVDNHQGQQDQDTYLRALRKAGAVDHVEYGTYVARVANGPLATKDKAGKPVLVTSDWPVQIKDSKDRSVPNARFMVSVARREEKGSDVNVASHLLIDALEGSIEAAVVVSNDSDLAYPVAAVRQRIPVGVVNPSKNYTAGALRGDAASGAGGHWSYSLTRTDIQAAQMSPSVGHLQRPAGW